MTASSATEIANQAIAHCGVDKEIASLDDDQTKEARACRRFYESVRNRLLTMYDWKFATAFATLALIESDPNDEWSYSYGYPDDALKIRRVLSANFVGQVASFGQNVYVSYFDQRDMIERVPQQMWQIVQNDSGKRLYMNQEDAKVEYTKRLEKVVHWPDPFQEAVAVELALRVAPQLTLGKHPGIVESLANLATVTLKRAMKVDAESEPVAPEPDSEFVRVR